MAVPIHSSASTSFFHTTPSISPPSLSCFTKVFVGLQPQNSSPFASAIPNLTTGFYDRVSKSLHSRYGSKPTRGRVNMMPLGIPLVLYRKPGEGTEQWMDIFNVLYRKRVIFIGQYIDEYLSNQLVATMLYLDNDDDSARVYIYLNGPGGNLYPSLAILDTMQSLRSPISTHCIGWVDNMIGFFLAAGDKGYRSAMPLSRIAIQSPVGGGARGQADDIRIEADELLRIKDYLYKKLAKYTGQTVEKINEDLAYAKRFSSQEALEYGIIDRVVRPPGIEADTPRKDSTAGLG